VKKIRYWLEEHAVLALAWVTRALPRHLLMSVCRVVGFLAWLIDVRGRSDGAENVRVAFNGQKDWWQCHRVVLAAYQNFARTFADLFWVTSVARADWRQHFDLHIQPDAQAMIDADRGAIWVTPHYGNFELSSIVWGFLGKSYTIVAQDFKNPALTRLFSEARSATGHRMIPQEGAMIRLIKVLAKGGSVAFLTDLNVKPDKAAQVIECFGRKTCVTKIHIAMARRLGVPVQPAVCRPLEDGRYEMVVFAPVTVGKDESDAAATQRVWDVFEKEIRQHPELWMWMYKHWRYKPADAGSVDYPAYANESWRFERVLKAQSLPNG
jgi:Kdo2-lipid IVA lauroyltransferase/acyltransferase